MRTKVLVLMGTIMLVCMVILGMFSLPVGITICSILGLFYGIKSKDRSFKRWSVVALIIGLCSMIYMLILIRSM